MNNPDIQELKTKLSYDPETGLFTWLKKRRGPKTNGAIAGNVGSKGYVHIGHRGKLIAAHRLAWAFMTGEWPVNQIDHINLTRADNRWENLRHVGQNENQWNSSVRKDNALGIKGVRFVPHSGKFQARIKKNGVRVSLGMFATAEEAQAARVNASAEHHGEFARN